ncbi:MAG: hypothetical protein WC860_00030 [Candidatus Margulisiibacteriota bacterium]|jgi:hypothetical protein
MVGRKRGRLPQRILVTCPNQIAANSAILFREAEKKDSLIGAEEELTRLAKESSNICIQKLQEYLTNFFTTQNTDLQTKVKAAIEAYMLQDLGEMTRANFETTVTNGIAFIKGQLTKFQQSLKSPEETKLEQWLRTSSIDAIITDITSQGNPQVTSYAEFLFKHPDKQILQNIFMNLQRIARQKYSIEFFPDIDVNGQFKNKSGLGRFDIRTKKRFFGFYLLGAQVSGQFNQKNTNFLKYLRDYHEILTQAFRGKSRDLTQLCEKQIPQIESPNIAFLETRKQALIVQIHELKTPAIASMPAPIAAALPVVEASSSAIATPPTGNISLIPTSASITAATTLILPTIPTGFTAITAASAPPSVVVFVPALGTSQSAPTTPKKRLSHHKSASLLHPRSTTSSPGTHHLRPIGVTPAAHPLHTPKPTTSPLAHPRSTASSPGTPVTTLARSPSDINASRTPSKPPALRHSETSPYLKLRGKPTTSPLAHPRSTASSPGTPL